MVGWVDVCMWGERVHDSLRPKSARACENDSNTAVSSQRRRLSPLLSRALRPHVQSGHSLLHVFGDQAHGCTCLIGALSLPPLYHALNAVIG